MDDAVFASFMGLLMAAFIGGLIWVITAHPQPCQGGWSIHGQTGIYHYQDKTIRCYRGQVVDVHP